jgi:alkylation response protein AidB-like acyl-CoA dehydrogenase
MDFRFSEEQDAIRGLAREILVAEATSERIVAAERSHDWIDEALWKQCAAANLLGIAVGEEYGGMGMGFVELCVLLEEVGRATAPGPWTAALVSGGLPLAEFGADQQKRSWLPRIVSGDTLVVTALEDARAREPALPATEARRDGDGWLLEGHKCAVPFARRAEALLIPARSNDGVGLFLVGSDAAGLSLEGQVTSTGEPIFDVILDGVRVASDARLPGDGAAQLRWLWPHALLAIAALQIGVSARALEITADYTREREQFKVPIGTFQAVQHREADAFIDLEAMRWTLWHAAWRLSQGLPAEREADVAVFWAADGGSRIANASIHLHGGLGSDVDYPIHRHFLWSKALELQLGGASATLARLGSDMARTGPLEDA